MDETDRRIVHCLQGDARNVTTAEIGDRLGISGSTVANRISQLEEAGVIAGYTPIVDYEQSGYPQHRLFVGTVAREDREAVVADIAEVTGVVDVTALLTDQENVLVEAVAETPAEVESVAEAMSRLDVTVVRTDVVTERITRSFDGFGERQTDDG